MAGAVVLGLLLAMLAPGARRELWARAVAGHVGSQDMRSLGEDAFSESFKDGHSYRTGSFPQPGR